MSIWDKIQYQFNKGDSPIRKLIIINVAVFLLSGLVMVVGRGYGQEIKADSFLKLFYTPARFTEFLSKPWSIFTYMFFHFDLRHILGNMFLLYFIGRILLDFQSNRNFYTIYFGGGIAGALLYLITFALFPNLAGGSGFPMQGASGAVISVVIAAAILVPNYEVFLFGAFRVKVKWIAAFFVVTDLVYFNGGNQGGHLAHIGGAIFGTLYMLNEQGRLNLSFLNSIPNPFKKKYTIIDERDIIKGGREKVKTEHTSSKSSSKSHHSGSPRQEEIDAILDKINQSGYPSLTKEEKDLLFRASDK